MHGTRTTAKILVGAAVAALAGCAAVGAQPTVPAPPTPPTAGSSLVPPPGRAPPNGEGPGPQAPQS
ncbi:hypothetical protein ACWFR1_19360, partial [Streptomyces sp. NPDC055103]